MGTTRYVVNNVLNHVLGNEVFSPPHPLYVALGTKASAQADGSWPDELSGNGYRRVPLCRCIPKQPPMNAGVVNALWLRFPTATADWGILEGYAIYDAPENGNMYFFGTIYDKADPNETGITVRASEWATIAPGDLWFGYFSVEDFDDGSIPGETIYSPGYLIGAQVLDLVFNGIPFDAQGLWAIIDPVPGPGYAPVNVTGYFNAVDTGEGTESDAVSCNLPEIEFPTALDDWMESTLYIELGNGGSLFSFRIGDTPYLSKGDQFVIGSNDVQLQAASDPY